MGLSTRASMFKTVSTSIAEKYPVRDSAKAGIPSELNTLKNSSAHPERLRRRITMSRFLTAHQTPFFWFQTFMPVSGSVSSRILEATSLASVSFAV